MTETSLPNAITTDASQVRLWIVCESGTRWVTATRRFITELMPDDLAAVIRPTKVENVAALLNTQQPAVVLWEIDPATIASAYDAIAATTIAAPHVLQIAATVATVSISDQETMALTELGATIILRQPEQLPSLTRLLHRYFS